MEATTKITIQCAACGAKYNVPDNYGNRKIQCRKCGKFIFIKGDGSPSSTTSRRPSGPRPAPKASEAPRSSSKLALILPLVALVASLVVIVVVLKMFLLK